MLTRCAGLLLPLLLAVPDLGCGGAPDPGQGEDQHQVSWVRNLLGLNSKRTPGAVQDANTFFAIRGKRGGVPDGEFWGIRGKKHFIKPNGFFQALPNSAKARKSQDKRSLKPNSIFGAISGKRSLKPNSLFGSISGKRNMKPNSLFGTFGKRNLKPNSLFGSFGKRMKPNSLFLALPSGKRSIKPNGIFGIRSQRNYKPNGLFSVGKKNSVSAIPMCHSSLAECMWGTPSHLFGMEKRSSRLKPNGLFSMGKRDFFPISVHLDEEDLQNEFEEYEDEDPTYSYLEEEEEEELEEELDSNEVFSDEGMVEAKRGDSDFWAARGKREANPDFWATRGKREGAKDMDFWAARGKRADDITEEVVDEGVVKAQEEHHN